MTWTDAAELVKTITAKVGEYDRAETSELCKELIRRVRATEDPFPDDDAKQVLSLLRRKRWFDLMEDVGDAFIQTGVTAPAVRRLHVQALLDQGHLVAGESVAKALVTATEDDPEENAERYQFANGHAGGSAFDVGDGVRVPWQVHVGGLVDEMGVIPAALLTRHPNIAADYFGDGYRHVRLRIKDDIL